MRQNKYILFCSLLVLVLSSFSACDKEEDLSVLPQETQSGKNTFGCKINGQNFFGGYLVYTLVPGFLVYYNHKTDYLDISTTGKFQNNTNGMLHLTIFNPRENTTTKIYKAEFDYISSPSNLFDNYGVLKGGEVTITKLDTVNKIVSGRFNFVGTQATYPGKFNGNDSIAITDGRFDLKIYEIL
jgi:hypothetical protein